MINAEDYSLILGLAAYVVGVVMVILTFLRWTGQEIQNFLTTLELRLTGRIVAIVIMVVLILLFSNAFTLPEEMFIYGRF